MNTEQITAEAEAASIYSDLHKDFYGFRPRGDVAGWTETDFRREIAAIKDLINRQRNTFDGREKLRIDGWVADETDPVLQRKAIENAERRDEFLKARYGKDWDFYGSPSMLEAPKLRQRWGVA